MNQNLSSVNTRPYHGIIDTHAHMDDPCFWDHIGEVLEAEQKRGVEMIIQSGSELASSRRSIELAGRFSCIVASVGVYPDEVLNIPENYLEQLRIMACQPGVVAIGEIGMDRGFPAHPPVEAQEPVFREQLDLARELQLPVVIHNWDADEDVLRILSDYPQIGGVIHRIFSDLPYAREFLEMGLYMGIGPQVTYPGSERLVDLVREMPLDRLLLETDAPFLPPHGQEGVKALPSMIADVADKIAAIRSDVTPQEVIDTARANAIRLYHLPL